MEQYLIDTNSVCNYFVGNIPKDGLLFVDKIFDSTPNISVISQIELSSWKTNINLESQIQNFIADSNIFGLSEDIISLCIDIRRNYKIKTPDAIIAATALSLDFTLITSDTDFEKISNLKIINPFK